ncbi:ROK family protein [Micromonospora sp. BRA006-A]|nr:ROK family protein [Micromonospora sp. BRA006-A]
MLASDGPAGLGLEVNVDYLAACVVDLTGTVRHHLVRRADLRPVSPPTRSPGSPRWPPRARRRRTRRADLAGAALAVPGLVGDDGLVRLAPNLGWRDVDVPALLAGHPLAEPVDGVPPLVVDSEANLAALGELYAGPAGPHSFLHVTGEIGIGAGIVLDGALYRGARGWSGEIGHFPVQPQGGRAAAAARAAWSGTRARRRSSPPPGYPARNCPLTPPPPGSPTWPGPVTRPR